MNGPTATPETAFEVITDGECLVLRPVRDPKAEQRFRAALESVHERFGRALRRLAE